MKTLTEQKASIAISDTCQFHQNMLALLQHWFPGRSDTFNHDTLLDIYLLVPYNPLKKPTEYQRQAIQKYLLTYKVGK